MLHLPSSYLPLLEKQDASSCLCEAEVAPLDLLQPCDRQILAIPSHHQGQNSDFTGFLSFENFSKNLDMRPWMTIRYIPSVPFWRVWGIYCDSQTSDSLIHFNPLKTWGVDRYHDFTNENLRLPLACELGSFSW